MSHTTSEDAALEPVQEIDLATALGIAGEELGQDGQAVTIGVCADPIHRRAYWAFLTEQRISGRTIHEAHPLAAAFLAHRDGLPAGAAALIPDSALGLPLPEAFQPALTRLRQSGRQLALLDPLVIPAELPARVAGLVMRTLLRLALLTARRLEGCSDVLVRCEPHYARFFTQVFLFAVEAEQPATADGPAQTLLRLDLDLCAGEWFRLYGDGAWSPYSLYVKPTSRAARVIEWLRRRRQPPSFHELVTTWIDPSDGFPPSDRASLAALCRLYPGLTEYLAVHRSGSATRRRARAAGTGPFPRIRTPLPWEDLPGGGGPGAA